MTTLTGDQKLMLETVRKFMLKEVAPYSQEMDEDQYFKPELKQKFKDLGLFSAIVPVKHGGMGLDLTSFCLVIEEISKVDAAIGVVIQDHGTGLRPLLLCNDESLKKEMFSNVAKNGISIGFAITEPQAGSDTASITTRAVRNGKNYILNGRKTFITNAGISDYYIVFALTTPEARHRGMSAFLVDGGSPGLEIGKKENKLGLRASPTADLILEDVIVPEKYRIGEENNGFLLLMETLDASRPTIAAQGLGIAEAALKYAIKYAGERHQFGKPIIDFQGLEFLIVDMATQIEAARALLYKTTRLYDEGFEDVTPYSAMSKLLCTDVAMRVTTDAVQVLGGYGCMKDHPVERMMRDAKVTQIYEGTNQIQRVIIGRSIKKKGYPFHLGAEI
jgi:alkylation response protein AidB-like acyl-CoA dehydrogenase